MVQREPTKRFPITSSAPLQPEFVTGTLPYGKTITGSRREGGALPLNIANPQKLRTGGSQFRGRAMEAAMRRPPAAVSVPVGRHGYRGAGPPLPSLSSSSILFFYRN
ncbi:hypothetical protein FACS1894110_19500 [Spirochaetia bacterium]|nr:hypothetical protein FACS1894110_19500 [Spirochaetia bacterium]